MPEDKFRTPMLIAIDKDDLVAVIQLIELGFDPDAVDPISERPYTQVAQRQGAYAIRDLLLELGADPEKKSGEGRTLEEYRIYLNRRRRTMLRGEHENKVPLLFSRTPVAPNYRGHAGDLVDDG